MGLRMWPVAGVASLLALAVAAGGSGGGRPAGPQRHHGSFWVLESPQYGPELCNSIRESLPPQCRGMPVVGWAWGAAEGAETLSGTTWGRWHVTGVFHGTTFVVTERPGRPRDRPADSDVPPRDRPWVPPAVEARLAAVLAEVQAAGAGAGAGVGMLESAYTDSERGVVVAMVWLARPADVRAAGRRWGDLVELRSLLRPVG